MRWIALVCLSFVVHGVAAAEEPTPPTIAEVLPEPIACPADGGETAQIRHLLVAAEHLAAAGKHDDAARWRAEADRARRHLLARKLDALARLQAEIEELRGEVAAPHQVCLECKLIEFRNDAIAQLGQMGAGESLLAQILRGELGATNVVDDDAPTFKVLDNLCHRGVAKVIAEPKLMTIGGRAAMFQVDEPLLARIGQPQSALRFECLPLQSNGGTIRLKISLRLSKRAAVSPEPKTREIETGADLRPGQVLVTGDFVAHGEVAPRDGGADSEPGSNGNDANAKTQILVLVKPTLVGPAPGLHADRRANPASFGPRESPRRP